MDWFIELSDPSLLAVSIFRMDSNFHTVSLISPKLLQLIFPTPC